MRWALQGQRATEQEMYSICQYFLYSVERNRFTRTNKREKIWQGCHFTNSLWVMNSAFFHINEFYQMNRMSLYSPFPLAFILSYIGKNKIPNTVLFVFVVRDKHFKAGTLLSLCVRINGDKYQISLLVFWQNEEAEELLTQSDWCNASETNHRVPTVMEDLST